MAELDQRAEGRFRVVRVTPSNFAPAWLSNTGVIGGIALAVNRPPSWNAHSEFGKGAKAMTKNMGTLDRVIRTVIALTIVALYLGGRISGTAAVLLGIVAAIFLVTSSVGVCPGYLPFGFSTRPERRP